MPEEKEALVAQKLEKHFCANQTVKRRDPDYYIKNPSRVYAVSLGKNHYTINKMAKETFLSKQNRNRKEISQLIPNAPKLSTNDKMRKAFMNNTMSDMRGFNDQEIS